MLKVLLIPFVMLPIISKAQKVLYDKTDPFTNERTINIGNVILTNNLQSAASAKIKDTSRVFYLSFLMQSIPGLVTETTDSALNECLLKSAEGLVYYGKWFGSTQLPIGSMVYNSSTFIFSEEDIKAISVADITNLKINGVLYEPPGKNVGNTAKLCRMLLDKL
jgi:hypothetical protein